METPSKGIYRKFHISKNILYHDAAAFSDEISIQQVIENGLFLWFFDENINLDLE